jgi:hypothetical protein
VQLLFVNACEVRDHPVDLSNRAFGSASISLIYQLAAGQVLNDAMECANGGTTVLF